MSYPDYGAVRIALINLTASLDPKAPPAPPTTWERLRDRLRRLV
jgi:hypothetical protein